MGYLLDQLDEYGLRLILALQDREYDTSDPTDRLLLTFMAMQDEHYANDIALKAKDSIAYRKAQGKTVGMPPFGSVRAAHPYPLARLLFCAQCERNARKQDNPRLRARLSGVDQYGKLRYRHAEGVRCGCRNRSVYKHVIEDDFKRLTIISGQAQANTVTSASSFGGGGAGEDVATFSGQIGDTLNLLAYGGKWYITGAVSYTHLTLPTIYSV